MTSVEYVRDVQARVQQETERYRDWLDQVELPKSDGELVMSKYPHDSMARNLEIERLGEDIFGLVQDDQGKGFVSDGLITIKTEEHLFNVVRGALYHTRRATRIMEKWLKEHDEY